MKTDAAVVRASPLAGIAPHAATISGLLVIVTLACGLALAFALFVQHVSADATVQTDSGLDRWRDAHTSWAVPHVVDRWFDELALVD